MRQEHLKWFPMLTCHNLKDFACRQQANKADTLVIKTPWPFFCMKNRQANKTITISAIAPDFMAFLRFLACARASSILAWCMACRTRLKHHGKTIHTLANYSLVYIYSQSHIRARTSSFIAQNHVLSNLHQFPRVWPKNLQSFKTLDWRKTAKNTQCISCTVLHVLTDDNGTIHDGIRNI